jgi:hypothetical protein
MPTCGLILGELPPSLTRLELTALPIDVGISNWSKSFPNLASLTSLTINQVTFSDGSATCDGLWWLARILTITTQLLDFKCIFSRHALIRNQPILGEAIPDTLESLNVDQTVIGHMTHWPPHLTSLEIHFISKWFVEGDKETTFLIPASVTRLTLDQVTNEQPGLIDRFIKSGFYLADPSTLHHLSIHYTYTTIDDVMQAVSVLNSLHSLTLKSSFGMNAEVDVKMLPRSLRWLDHEHVIPSSDWQHLPPNIQFPHDQRSIHIKSTDSDEQVKCLPESLQCVTVFHRPLPKPLPQLEHIIFNFTVDTGIPIPPRSTCELYLVNLPRMLRSIAVTCADCNNLFWLHDDGDDASRFELQFPCLTKLSLTLHQWWEGVELGQVKEWFRHLPKTLYSLSLCLLQPKSVTRISNGWLQRRSFDLTDTQFPRLLEHLNLDFTSTSVIFPNQLPDSLQQFNLKVWDVLNAREFCALIDSKPNLFRHTVNVRDVLCRTVKQMEAALIPQPIGTLITS